MTMTSGAVFFDTHMEKQDGKIERQDGSKSSNSLENEEEREELADVREDALMKQAVMATQRKTELLKSVKKLNEQDSEESRGETSDSDIEFNLKPSTLRRLSKTSQILHLENIAKMKKRRSQTDFDIPMESTPPESENEMESSTTTSQPSHQRSTIVLEMTEVFTRRSRKHIREYARRRTVDNYPSEEKGFSKSVLTESDEVEEDITLEENERSFHTMEVDVSDLVQRHHQMIRDKTCAPDNEGVTSRTLQRHQSFPSSDRLYQQGGKAAGRDGGKTVTESDQVVRSIVGNLESKKDMKTTLNMPCKENKRPCSLNIEHTSLSSSSTENVSIELTGRRRASTDVDLRSRNSSVD